MNFHFNSKQIVNELRRMEEVKQYSWEYIISQRLDSNIKALDTDLDKIVKSLSNKNPLTLLRRL